MTLERLREDVWRHYAFDVRLANKSVIEGSGSPSSIGDSLFNDGVRYGAVSQDLEPAMPFFSGSRLAFELGLKRPVGKRKGTVYDTLYQRFTQNFGFFASSELLSKSEQPSNTTHFRVALAAMQMAFTSSVLRDAGSDPGAFETADFAGYLLTFLALNASGRRWGIPVDPIVEQRIASLPIPKPFERLRRPLAELAVGSGEDVGALEEYRRAFRAAFHPGAYELGLIGGVRFTEAYILSLAKESGRMTTALVRLFDA